jgi:hypothetical protein
MNEPQKNVQMTLKDQSFVNKVKVSFMCNPEDVRPSNFGKCLKTSQIVTKNIFFLKILNFVQSFVECKVSLADRTSVCFVVDGCNRAITQQEYRKSL